MYQQTRAAHTYLRAGLMISALFCLTACTTQLKTSPAVFAQRSEGQVYYLPKAEIQVTVARELKACSFGYESDADAAIAWLNAQLNVAKTGNTAKDRTAMVKSILDDPVLARPDVVAAVDAALGPNWRRDLGANEEAMGALLPRLLPQVPRAQGRFDVDISAQAAPHWVADLDHAYSISYELMHQALKGTDYAIETYPNGTLKSVNITIDDQTGPAIQSFVSGVAKVAAAVGGFPLGGAQKAVTAGIQAFADWKAQEVDKVSLCKPDVRFRLLQRAGLQAQLEADGEAGMAMLKGIAKLEKAQVNQIAERDKLKASLEAMDESDPKRSQASAALKKAEADLRATGKAVADAKASFASAQEVSEKTAARLASIRKSLTVSRSTMLQPKHTKLAFPLEGAQEAEEAWVNPQVAALCKMDNQCDLDMGKLRRALAAHAGVLASVRKVEPMQAAVAEGIVYRQPVKATLLVCKQLACVDASGDLAAEPSAVVLSGPVDLPQLGPLAVLPLKNTAFQNNTIGASFSEGGGLTKLTYKSNAAAAEAAKVFDASADTVVKFKEAKRNQEKAKLDVAASELEARKKMVEAQLALEKAQADLAKFRDSQSSASQ